MKRWGLAVILVLLAGVPTRRDEAASYRTEVFGDGVLTFSQPRCVRVGPGGRLWFLEGENEQVFGRTLSADLKESARFGSNSRSDENVEGWFHPAGIRPVSNGEVLVADTGRKRILLLDADGRFKRVVVDDATLAGPTDALVLPTGDVVVCDSASSRVLLYDAAGKLKKVLASPGKGPGEVNHPFSLALDRAGGLWIVDTLNRRLVACGPDLAVWRVLLPVDGADTLLLRPSYLDFDREGNLLVADDGRGCVFRLSPDGKLLRRIGLADGELRPFARVSGVTVLGDGTIVVSDASRGVLFRFDPDGKYLGETGLAGWGGRRTRLFGLGVAPDGGFCLVMEKPVGVVISAGADGLVRTCFGGEGTQPGNLLRPRAAAMGPDGCLYVADSENHNVTVFRADGVLVRVFGKPGRDKADMYYPRAVSVSDEGEVFVGDAGNRRVQVYRSTGEFLRTFATGVSPYFIDVGPGGECAVYDDAEAAVVVFDRSGREQRRLDTGDVRDPGGLAFAPDGKLWLLDGGRRAILTFDAKGSRSELLRDDALRGASPLARGRDGRMYVNLGGICPIGTDGKLGTPVVTRVDVPAGQTVHPSSVALVWDDALAVWSQSAIQVFGRDGKFRGTLTTTPAILAAQLAAGPSGELFALDVFAGKVYHVHRDGQTEVVASGRGLRGGGMFVVGPDGSFYTLSDRRQGLVKLDGEGRELGRLTSGRGEGEFRWPSAFCVTPTGDLLLADWDRGNLFCYGSDLKFKWKLEQGELPGEGRSRGGIRALAADSHGNFYALWTDPDCIRKYPTSRDGAASGGVVTIRPDPDSSGRFGGFGSPRALAVDADGTLFVADTDNNRLLKFVPGP